MARGSVRPLTARGDGDCPEIDCIRNLLPRYIIAAAEKRARAIGLGADSVLINADAVTEETYLTALASSLGTFYEPLDGVSRADCPLDDNRLIQAAATGLLPLREGNDLVWIIAPRYLAARRLAGFGHGSAAPSFRLTSNERLAQFVAPHIRHAIGQRAAEGLRRTRPWFSSAPRRFAVGWVAAAVLVLLAATLLAALPSVTVESFAAPFCVVFLAAAALRLACVAFADKAPTTRRPPARVRDHQLPVYTIICALYREANVVENLVAAIRSLDYPREKLDVKFVLEPDDHETRRALARLDLGPLFDIIVAPSIGPRTKPKALNVALPFARGTFTVVYDAEDVPEPDQLRRAFDKFRAADERLACVQASLTIDNTTDSWLAGMFTAAYAGQFDAFLPGLAALRLPLPLGGSSNHFRTVALRRAEAWDPYNVTEDADLGIRLYRLGYRSATLASATYEEAPAHFGPWLRQRTRWYKGWMQTSLVHMRRPLRLLRELGPLGVVAFLLFLAGNIVAALIHPVFTAVLAYSLLSSLSMRPIGQMHAAPMFVATLLAGYASTIMVDLIGLRRRGLLRHAWVLLLTPIYWFLLSLAAWRALYQLLTDPQRWEKTEHGLARSSRLAAADTDDDGAWDLVK